MKSKLSFLLIMGLSLFNMACNRGYGCPTNFSLDLSTFFQLLGF